MRTTLQELLRPELIAILREHLPPLNSALLERFQHGRNLSQDTLLSTLSGQYEGISSNIRSIKLQLENPGFLQQRIERCILEGSSRLEEGSPSQIQKVELDQLPVQVDTDSHFETLKEM